MHVRPLWIALGLGVFAAFTGFYLALWQLGVLPRLAFAPGWSLSDQNGEKVTSEDLRGSVSLYVFTSFRQAASEPAADPNRILRQVKELLDENGRFPVPIRLVSISFDSRDDTALLKRRAEALGASSSDWLLLNGAADTVQRVVRDGFGVYYEKTEDGSYFYDPVFVVVDGLGIVRAKNRFGLPTAETLMAQLRSVVEEASAAEGAERLAYEAAHFFSCYSSV